jgi:hypothetical protein
MVQPMVRARRLNPHATRARSPRFVQPQIASAGWNGYLASSFVLFQYIIVNFETHLGESRPNPFKGFAVKFKGFAKTFKGFGVKFEGLVATGKGRGATFKGFIETGKGSNVTFKGSVKIFKGLVGTGKGHVVIFKGCRLTFKEKRRMGQGGTGSLSRFLGSD